ncbi:hypothetical protein [Streptomyces venezuelae]|uniref:hypothetical protein n=1 Tax=Streptomyces venezuelae TaxID=54571 RepID=UPI00343D9C97
MNGLVSELLVAGVSMTFVFPLLLILALALLIRAAASAAATIIRARHPGVSEDAVAMQADRIGHRQWKLRRRDANRRVRAGRRALVRAEVRARFAGRRTARYADGPVVLPKVILSGEEPPRLTVGASPTLFGRTDGSTDRP